MTTENSRQANTRLLTISQWTREHNWPPQGGLRYLIFNEKTNGFHKVIKRIGKRVLIDENAFFEWVNQQNEESNA